ncbi:hypothetical protein RsoM2USA_267 [Ralstonia phage RsoM2USA]|nr:hypothetical protein RsoM2USA_267 [Ralstonia phage RsoM2USA]
MKEYSDTERLAMLHRIPKDLIWSENMRVHQESVKWYLENNLRKSLIVTFRRCSGLDINFVCDLISIAPRHITITCSFNYYQEKIFINGSAGVGYIYKGVRPVYVYDNVFDLQQYIIDNDLEAAIEKRL